MNAGCAEMADRVLRNDGLGVSQKETGESGQRPAPDSPCKKGALAAVPRGQLSPTEDRDRSFLLENTSTRQQIGPKGHRSLGGAAPR